MNKKGFTLLELITTIVVMGILAGFIIVQMRGTDNVGDDVKRKSDIEIIKNAIIAYKSENYNNAPIANCNIGENCPVQFDSALSPYIGSLPEPDPKTTYTYLSEDGTECSVSAVLSDSSIYEYICSTNDIITVFPIGGVCGISNMQTFVSEPDGGFCNSGSASPLNFSGTNSAWSWNCYGQNGGSTSSCLAFYESNFYACRTIAQAEVCSVSEENSGDPSASAVALFNMHSLAGGHAELVTQSNYSSKVCCEGSALTGDPSTTVLRLSSATNAHVEKNTHSYYSNNITISAFLKTITCSYASSCSTLGADYSCVASVSSGDTNLHVGDCNAYATKVCCELKPQ